MPSEPAPISPTQVTEHATCLACGCLCDDIRVEVATALGSVAKSNDSALEALEKAAGDALRQIDEGRSQGTRPCDRGRRD